MENKIKVKWVRVNKRAKIPVFAKDGDAGADISVIEDVVLKPFEKQLISTGLQVEVPKGYEVQIRPRSGVALKTPLLIANSPGTIDSGYRGEVKIIVWNLGQEEVRILAGDRLAQVVVSKLPEVEHVEVEVGELSETERGSGGFGSTGI
jgi:dUTP pyrophosphatase